MPETEKEADRFDPASLCYSLVENGSAAILTDFRQDEDGLTQILILARDLTPARAGALAQRLLEIETYRTLALLSLPLTRSMTSELRHMESRPPVQPKHVGRRGLWRARRTLEAPARR